MKKLPIFVVVFVMLCTLLFCGYFLALYVFDGSTSVVLKSYEITKDAEAVRRHLLERRGEGEGMTTRVTLLTWGRNNPDDFVEILEGISPQQRDQYCEILGFMATDSGQDRAFETAFQNHESDCLRMIRSGIDKSREWQQRTKNSPNP